jgi:hypothetical protein
LVKLQGEIIDNIEQNIRTAKDYVMDAEKNIIKSKENMQAARKVNIRFYLEKMLYSFNCSSRFDSYYSTYFS